MSWRVAILAMLGEQALFAEYKPTEPWDSEHNKKLIPKMPAIYAPVRGKAGPGETFYQGFVGPGTVHERGQRLHLALIKDGTATTVYAVEAGTPIAWTNPADIPFDPANDLPKLGGLSGGDFPVVMASGDVKVVKKDFDPAEFKKIITRDGKESVDFDKLWKSGPVPEATSASTPAANAAELPAPIDSAAKLKKIRVAVCNYYDVYMRFPSATALGKDRKPVALSWRVTLLEFLGEKALYDQFHLDEPWDSAHNKTLLTKMPAVYAPAGGTAGPGETFYQLFVGPGTVFDPANPMSMTTIGDGTATTLLATEAGTPVPWTKPADLVFDPAKELPKLGAGGGDFNAVLVGGDVLRIKKGFDPAEFKKLVTANGGEVIDFTKLMDKSPFAPAGPIATGPTAVPVQEGSRTERKPPSTPRAGGPAPRTPAVPTRR